MTYSPEDFVSGKAPPKEDPADIQWEDGVDAGAAYKKALANGLIKKAIKLLNSHGDAKYNSASEADFALMGYLHRARLSPSENAAVIFDHPRGDDIVQRHPDVWNYMKISLSKIYPNGRGQDAETDTFDPYGLAEVETAFSKWLLLQDYKALHAILAAVAAHRAGGDGVCGSSWLTPRAAVRRRPSAASTACPMWSSSAASPHPPSPPDRNSVIPVRTLPCCSASLSAPSSLARMSPPSLA